MGIAYVQSNSGQGAATAAPTVAFTSNNTAGNLLIIAGLGYVSGLSSGAVGVASDTKGNTYNQVTFVSINTDCALTLWYVKGCLGGANTVKIDWASGTAVDYAMIIAEYSGIDTSAPLLTNNTGSGTGTTMTTPSISPAGSSDLYIGLTGMQSSTSLTLSHTGSFTSRQMKNAGAAGTCGIGFSDLIGSGSQSDSWSVTGGSTNYGTIISAYRLPVFTMNMASFLMGVN